MIQPNSKVFSYRPFRFSFLFSIFALTFWIIMLIVTVQNCATKCFYNDSFNFPCTQGSALYCCSIIDSSGPYSCDYYTSCQFDNDVCGVFNALTWTAGAMLLLGTVIMAWSAYKFKKLKAQALANYQLMAQQHSNGWENNQPYGMQNQYGSNQQVYRQI